MSNTEHFKNVLDSTQKKICVIAGPGSGKTKGILIPKAKHLLASDVNPKEILLLSFSRLSASDLKMKVRALDKTPRTSTVHGFCLAYLLGEDDHGIRDRIESIVMDFELEFLIHDLKLIFPDYHKRNLKKELKLFAAGWATRPHETVFEADDFQKRFKAGVVNWLIENKAVMMDEIVYFSLDHLRKAGKPPSLESIKYILVDEYQDLNKLEQEFVDLLAAGSELLLVVGDPDQSIYSFKYAWPDGILGFSGLADVDDFSLPYCGRCAKSILDAANQILLQTDPQRNPLPKPLEEKSDGVVEIHKPFANQELEFQFVFDSLKKRIESSESPADILVLIPKRKLGKDFVEYADGRKSELPLDCKVKLITKYEFTERQQASILVLSLILNPDSVLHLRSYVGIGDNSGYASEISMLKTHYGGWDNFISNANHEDFPTRNKRLRHVCSIITALKQQITDLKEIGVEDLIKILFPIEDIELQELNAIFTSLIAEGDDAKDIFIRFLDFIRDIPHGKDTVRVMSIMSSKGLDAKHVYILGCNAGNIPGDNYSSHLDDFQHIQEQRRFLYVGFTRAQESLTVTWTQYIPFKQSKGHATPSVGVVKIGGKVMSKVGICPFLQDLNLA